MAGIPRHQGRTEPKIGPSDSSDTIADRPGAENTDTDAGGTGVDRVIGPEEAGLGGGLDQAEEARLRKPKR